MSQVPPAPPPGLSQPTPPASMGPSSGAPTQRASFWQRLVAALVDGILIGVVSSVLGAMLGSGYNDPATNGINFLLGLGYSIYLHGSPSGQTIGKKLMKIRVVGFADGGPIGYGRAALRYLGTIVSALPCGLGYLWMLWDSEKQTWHDKIATTVVVPESAAPVAKWPG